MATPFEKQFRKAYPEVADIVTAFLAQVADITGALILYVLQVQNATSDKALADLQRLAEAEQLDVRGLAELTGRKIDNLEVAKSFFRFLAEELERAMPVRTKMEARGLTGFD